jgi:hypothetical protein
MAAMSSVVGAFMIFAVAVFALSSTALGAAGPSSYKPTAAELAEAQLADPPVEGVVEADNGSVKPAGGGTILQTTEIEDPRITHQCWVEEDPCTSAYMLPVGSAYGEIGPDTLYANNWYDGGTDDCDANSDVGRVPDGEDLVLFLEGSRAIDSSTSADGCVEIRFYAAEYDDDAANCGGTMLRGWYLDTITFASTSAGRESALAYCDEKSDCAGDWGDNCNTWHRPDILFSDNVSAEYRWYKAMVYSRICDTDCSSNCSGWTSDTDGCFEAYRV